MEMTEKDFEEMELREKQKHDDKVKELKVEEVNLFEAKKQLKKNIREKLLEIRKLYMQFLEIDGVEDKNGDVYKSGYFSLVVWRQSVDFWNGTEALTRIGDNWEIICDEYSKKVPDECSEEEEDD